MSFLTKDYDYKLPKELIAAHALESREKSRMMVVNRHNQSIEHRFFSDILEYITPQDLLVLNNTKVIPARVFSDDGKIELLCLDRSSPTLWRCLVKPGKKMTLGKSVLVHGVRGVVKEVFENGDRLIEWSEELNLDQVGRLALPHYMEREDQQKDYSRYQTVFAKEEGAIAAPTAGLHFTQDILNQCQHDFLTLHVGVGTFRPVNVDDIHDHVMHSERYFVKKETCSRINLAQKVVAVGTTTTRVLEHLAKQSPHSKRLLEQDQQGETDIFIHPPYTFQCIDALLTNFHLPQSTLIMLVSAFAGRELILEAYNKAVEERYRFYSYGDCMLVL